MKTEKTKYFSWKNGRLTKGCSLCIQGKKLVLYVTGLCTEKCYYCPLSEKRKNKDLVWANEMPVKKTSDIISEAELCKACGAGITGGDPLLKFERTNRHIRMLKKRFGKRFHIHLYTPLTLVDEKKLQKLYAAGLDEIRFHPDIGDNRYWPRLGLAKKFNWSVGIEIPVIPGKEKEMKSLISFLKGKVDFLNLNELEISDTNRSEFDKRGFRPRDRLSHGVEGSEGLAKRLLAFCEGLKMRTHYCTTRLKDKVQLGNRLKRRAKSVAKRYDIITDDGLLYRGAIYPQRPCAVPRALTALKKEFQKRYDIPQTLIEVDRTRDRILTAAWILLELKEDIHKDFPDLSFAAVEEYPTCDLLQTDVDFL